MVPLAPRYDPRIVEAIALVDDRSQPIAETCRRVGAIAEQLGLIRPSYSHLRRLVHEQRDRADYERARRADLRAIAVDTAETLIAGRVPDPHDLLARIADVGS